RVDRRAAREARRECRAVPPQALRRPAGARARARILRAARLGLSRIFPAVGRAGGRLCSGARRALHHRDPLESADHGERDRFAGAAALPALWRARAFQGAGGRHLADRVLAAAPPEPGRLSALAPDASPLYLDRGSTRGIASSRMDLDVVYDGQCRFCASSLRLVRRLAPRDAFRLHDANDQAAIAARFPMLATADTDEAMFVVTARGEVFRGFFAFRRMMWESRRLRLLRPLFSSPGAARLGPIIYAWVARHRRRLGCSTACELPMPLEPDHKR